MQWNIDAAGDLIATAGNIIKVGTNSNNLIVSGGNAGSSGANVVLYSGTHATNANDIFFRAGINDVLTYDRSITNWNFRDQTLSSVGAITMSGGSISRDVSNNTFKLSGGLGVNDGANLELRGSTAGNPNNINFRASTTDVFNFDATATTWNFQNTHVSNIQTLFKGNATGIMKVSGGTTVNLGGNFWGYGETHASQANDIELRAAGAVKLQWDHSALAWNFGTNIITGVSDMRRGSATGSMTISGGTANNLGAFIALRGESHATGAKDIVLGANGISQFSYDDSASTWNLQSNTLNYVTGIYRGAATAALLLAGGSSLTAGAAFSLYGQSHATLANDMFFQANGVTKLHYDASITTFDFQDTDIATTGAISTGDLSMAGTVNYGAIAALTVTTNAITPISRFSEINTNTAAQTVKTISGGTVGDEITLCTNSSAFTLTLQDMAVGGNIQIGGDFIMTSPADTITLFFDGTNWREISRADNA